MHYREESYATYIIMMIIDEQMEQGQAYESSQLCESEHSPYDLHTTKCVTPEQKPGTAAVFSMRNWHVTALEKPAHLAGGQNNLQCSFTYVTFIILYYDKKT